jgi:hypothetical protein
MTKNIAGHAGPHDHTLDIVHSPLTSILARHLFSIPHNLVPDLGKVVEFLTGQVQEFSPLVGIVLVQLHLGHLFLEPFAILLFAFLGVAVGCRFGGCGAIDQLEYLYRQFET